MFLHKMDINPKYYSYTIWNYYRVRFCDAAIFSPYGKVTPSLCVIYDCSFMYGWQGSWKSIHPSVHLEGVLAGFYTGLFMTRHLSDQWKCIKWPNIYYTPNNRKTLWNETGMHGISAKTLYYQSYHNLTRYSAAPWLFKWFSCKCNSSAICLFTLFTKVSYMPAAIDNTLNWI